MNSSFSWHLLICFRLGFDFVEVFLFTVGGSEVQPEIRWDLKRYKMFFRFCQGEVGFFVWFYFFLAVPSLHSIYLGCFGTDNEVSLKGWEHIAADS